MNDQISNILSIIPQSYYDILAKVLPGFLAIELMIFEKTGEFRLPSNSWEVTLGISLIYTSGLCLDILGLFLSDLLDEDINWILEHLPQCLQKAFHFKHKIYVQSNQIYLRSNQEKILPYIDEIHQEVYKLKNSQDENIVVKMLAEIVLLRSLSWMFIVLILAHTVFEYSHIASYRFFEGLSYIYLILGHIFCFLLFFFLRIYLQAKAYSRINIMKQRS